MQPPLREGKIRYWPTVLPGKNVREYWQPSHCPAEWVNCAELQDLGDGNSSNMVKATVGIDFALVQVHTT